MVPDMFGEDDDLTDPQIHQSTAWALQPSTSETWQIRTNIDGQTVPFASEIAAESCEILIYLMEVPQNYPSKTTLEWPTKTWLADFDDPKPQFHTSLTPKQAHRWMAQLSRKARLLGAWTPRGCGGMWQNWAGGDRYTGQVEQIQEDTLPKTNIRVAPENRPLEKEIPIGNHHF